MCNTQGKESESCEVEELESPALNDSTVSSDDYQTAGSSDSEAEMFNDL